MIALVKGTTVRLESGELATVDDDPGKGAVYVTTQKGRVVCVPRTSLLTYREFNDAQQARLERAPASWHPRVA